jgi:hypothetical protein
VADASPVADDAMKCVGDIPGSECLSQQFSGADATLGTGYLKCTMIAEKDTYCCRKEALPQPQQG